MVLLLFSKLHLWRTKPFSSNMNPTVCLSTGGGDRDKAASVVYHWTWSRSILATFQTSYRLSPFLLLRLLSFPLSSFAPCSFYQSLAPSSPCLIFPRIALVLHSSLFIFYATLFALFLSFFLPALFLCLSSYLALYSFSLPSVNR